MILLEEQASLTDLHSLINKVPSYPVSVNQIINLGTRNHMPRNVTDFYKAFPVDEVFDDEDDLLSRTENVDILQHQTAPQEEMNAPEDD